MIVTGYVRGRPISISVEERGPVLVEVVTARAFDAMAAAAINDRIGLHIVSGWRSMIEQTRLYQERQDPAVRARKGPAARPGYSNHQTGRALDISVGMTVADLRAGRRTPMFDWLEKHAREFGFKRTVPVEPWHWELVEIPEERDDV